MFIAHYSHLVISDRYQSLLSTGLPFPLWKKLPSLQYSREDTAVPRKLQRMFLFVFNSASQE